MPTHWKEFEIRPFQFFDVSPAISLARHRGTMIQPSLEVSRQAFPNEESEDETVGRTGASNEKQSSGGAASISKTLGGGMMMILGSLLGMVWMG